MQRRASEDARLRPGSEGRRGDDNPALTLFHGHQQRHEDFGFMALFSDA